MRLGVDSYRKRAMKSKECCTYGVNLKKAQGVDWEKKKRAVFLN
jgi:hypothetical protein